ncbi:hypothetical protein [Bosea sp. 685]|uniref:hypothetical protein n=1 Tax=Bosea sp. 685 TaxID=3080057 RepID=UPI0028936695|nr:hypothetical protein [Bosea sp. 685]WNJ90458.1 hypothetical protein RMR04_29480 [Bosea sp. 685]
MFGGLGSFIASEISGAVKRNVIIYGLYGFSVLLVLCAAGYALNALHTVLALRYDPITASLWIAGGLFLAALLSLGVAAYVKNRRRPSRPLATTALAAAPIAASLIGSSRMGWRTAVVGSVIILGALIGRQFFNRGEDDEDEA